MFEMAVDRLAGAVASVVAVGVPADADAMVAVRALLDRLAAALAATEVAFDAGEGWRDRGAGSLRAWLADECSLSRCDAAAVARRADRLRRWPELLEAWRSGRVSGVVVDAACAAVPQRFVDRFASDLPDVLDILAPVSTVDGAEVPSAARALDGREVALVVRHWVRRAEADDGPDAFLERPSGAFLSETWGGRVRLDAELCPADGAVLAAALRVFDVPDRLDAAGRVIGRERMAAEKRADALVAMARFALDHDRRRGTTRSLPNVSLVVQLSDLQTAALASGDVDTFEELERLATRRSVRVGERALWDVARRNSSAGRSRSAQALDGAVGAPCVDLGPVAATLLTCDSVVHRVLMAGSRVIELGRDERTTPVWLRKAVIARDRHCRAPGCDRSARYCDVHHIDHWSLGGRTDLHRLVLLCSFHHHQFHRPGHRMAMDELARFEVEYPDGRRRVTVPSSVTAGAVAVGPDG